MGFIGFQGGIFSTDWLIQTAAQMIFLQTTILQMFILNETILEDRNGILKSDCFRPYTSNW